MRFVLALLAVVLVPGLAAAAGKIALVIGNDAYQQVTPLERAAADARAYRDTLSTERGFDVIYAENADRNEMIAKIGEFLGRIRPDDVAMVVYSGHGVQLDPNRGDTLYLLPTDIPSVDPGSGGASFFMDARAINFARLSTEVEARGAALRIFVLDACRNNPFPPAPGGRSIGLTRGLGSFNSSRGEFVFFAAAPGEVALDLLPDDDASVNSVFTRVFLKHFRQGEYLEDVANDVQAEVLELSRRAAISQEPYYTDGVAGKTCIDSECGVVPVPVAPAAPAPPDELEATFWRLCETRDTISYCKAYLDTYPEGPHALLAKLRVDELAATAASGQETGKPRLVTVGPASVTGQAPAPEPAPAVAAATSAPAELKSSPPVPLPLTTAPEPAAAAPAAEPAVQPAPPPEPDTKLAAVEPAQQAPSVADQQKAEEEQRARQKAAAQEWGRLAGSWDIRAVRDFRNSYPGTAQAAEADQRVAFLMQRHREAQPELNRLGYDAGPVDGAWGRRSAAALQEFETDNGLPRSGMVTEQSLSRLKTAPPRVASRSAAAQPAATQPAQPSPQAAAPATQPAAPSSGEDSGGSVLGSILGAVTGGITLKGGKVGGTIGGSGGNDQVAMATGNSLIPDGGRWIASGRTAQGSLINATLTRQGDRLELDAQFDHRGNTSYYPWMIGQYSKSCSEKASGKTFSCWFTGDVSTSSPTQPGAQVRGTLPNLTFEAHNLIGRVTLTSRPAP